MIGGLQGEFGDLDNKYLKQNISRCRSKILESFRRTPQHCILRENSPGKRYQRIRICLTGEVKTSSSPIRMWDIRLEDPDISDRGSWNVLLSHPAVRYPARGSGHIWPGKLKRPPLPSGCEISGAPQRGPSACTRYKDPSPWWHGAGIAIRRNSIQIPQEVTRRHAIRSNSIRIPQEDTRRHAIWTPSGRSTRHSWTSHSGR